LYSESGIRTPSWLQAAGFNGGNNFRLRRHGGI
jgi:hypothetical protein